MKRITLSANIRQATAAFRGTHQAGNQAQNIAIMALNAFTGATSAV